MQSPSPQYVCSSCQTRYDAPSKYCGRCGASLLSPLEAEDTHQGTENDSPEASETPNTGDRPPAKRRSADNGRDPWLGRVIDSRYRVIEMIGRGGMGAVYKVEHQRMGKVAAMKVLHSEYTDNTEVIERFRREAEAVSKLTHPNTVQVFDFGTTQGALYLIMEYVRGQDLGSVIRRDGPMPFERAAPILMQVCAALAEAHAIGIIHRDLKPENVLVTRTHRGRDFAKVLDFGLAKLNEPERPELSNPGAVVGTPYYMSPEQIRGEEVDARSDIYSLGALMYRVLTGEPAYTAKTPVGVLTKHLTAELVPPSQRVPGLGLHPRVDQIVVKAMAKRREARHATIGELLDHLESVFVELSDHSMPRTLLEVSSWSSTTDEAERPKAPIALEDSHDGVDYGIDSAVRLQRADLDEFEASLKRRRIIRIAAVPLLLCALAATLTYFLVLRPATPQRSEKEPNQQLDDATLIAPGTEVTGFIGQRINKTTPDRDYYRLTTGTIGQVATVHVTALPNIDIELSILDATGKLMAQTDEGGMGDDEWLRHIRIMGPVHILVTEAMPTGPRLPTENVSDPYLLTVTLDQASRSHESEPNDGESDAMRIEPGAPMLGYLDRRSDMDIYRFDGPRGRYRLDIEASAELPLVWELGANPPSSERRAEIELDRGAVIRVLRSDRELSAGKRPPGSDAPYRLMLQLAAGTLLP